MMKMFHKKKNIWVLAMFALWMQFGCDVLPPKKAVIKIELNPDIKIPLTSTYKASFADLLSATSGSISDNVSTDPATKLMTYTSRFYIARLGVSDIMRLGYKFGNNPTTPTTPTNAGTAAPQQISETRDETIELKLGSGINSKEVTRIVLDTASLRYIIKPIGNPQEGTPVNMTVTISSPDIKLSTGTLLSRSIRIGSTAPVSGTIDLKDASIGIKDGLIRMKYGLSIPGGSAIMTFGITDTLDIKKIKAIEGKFSETRIEIASTPGGTIAGEYEIPNTFSSLKSKRFDIHGASIKFYALNDLGVNFKLPTKSPDGALFLYASKSPEKKIMQTMRYGDNGDYGAIAALGRFGNTQRRITESIMSVPTDAITTSIDRISYDLPLVFEPQDLKASSDGQTNIIRNTDSMIVYADLAIPFRLLVEELNQTFEFATGFGSNVDDYTEYLDPTKNVSFIMNIENTIPFTPFAQVYFLDGAGKITDSVFKSGLDTITTAPNVDGEGFSISPISETVEIPLTINQVNALIRSSKVKVKVVVNSSNNNNKTLPISIRNTDYISIKTSVSLKAKIPIYVK